MNIPTLKLNIPCSSEKDAATLKLMLETALALAIIKDVPLTSALIELAKSLSEGENSYPTPTARMAKE